MRLKKGNILVADPSILNDDSFSRTVLLITEYHLKSTVGFIINRPLAYTIKDILPEIDCDFVLYEGGPVATDSLFYLHTIPHLIPNSHKITEKIYSGGDFEIVKDLLYTKQIQATDIRFFLGYTGWEKNQLENELKNKSWFISENNLSNILSVDTSTLWKNKLLEQGNEYEIWANAPKNIHWN